jgi:hypothetical protein
MGMDIIMKEQLQLSSISHPEFISGFWFDISKVPETSSGF